jgi:hypothetical protein
LLRRLPPFGSVLVASAAAMAAESGASIVAQVSYQMSKRRSLIGRAGSGNALDLVFPLSFD